MLLVQVPWADRIMALPFITLLAPSKRFLVENCPAKIEESATRRPFHGKIMVSIEGACAIEHGRAEPEPVGAWPMIGALPSCHWLWKNVHVREWLTDLLLGTVTALHMGRLHNRDLLWPEMT